MEPDEIVKALSEKAPSALPVAALRAASERRAELAPALIAEIERVVAAPPGERPSSFLCFYAFFLLAEWRETAAYRPLARLLRRPTSDLEEIFSDWVFGESHRVMVGVFDGDPQPLFEIALDPAVDEYIRSNIFEALAVLAVQGGAPRGALAEFLEDAFDRLEPRVESFTWAGWAQAIEWLGLSDLTPLVKQAFDAGFITAAWKRFSAFEEDLAYAQANPHAPFPPFGGAQEPWKDTVRELRLCPYGETVEEDVEILQPTKNPFRHVGRNDPCPCGSGKKFKKCCLGRAPEPVSAS